MFGGGFLSKEFAIDNIDKEKVQNLQNPDDYTCKLLKLLQYVSIELKIKALSLLVRHRGQREVHFAF